MDAAAAGQPFHRRLDLHVQLLGIGRAQAEAPGEIGPVSHQTLLGYLEIALGEGHIFLPLPAEPLHLRRVVVAVIEAVEVADELRGILDVADAQPRLHPLHGLPVFPEPGQQLLLLAYFGGHLVALFVQQGNEVPVVTVRHHIGHLRDAEAEMLEPEAVDEKIDVPGIIIPVVVVLVLLRPDHALFLVIPQQVRADPQDPGNVSDLVAHAQHPLSHQYTIENQWISIKQKIRNRRNLSWRTCLSTSPSSILRPTK